MSLVLPSARTAVVVIECQNDLVDESRIGIGGISSALAAAVRDADVLAHIAKVLTAARLAAVPVIYANKESKAGIPTTNAAIFRIARADPILREGSWGAEVHSRIAPVAGDYVVRRFLGVDASADSTLFTTLRALNRSVMVAMGVSTNFAVEGTVRGAVNQLFEVVVPADCCASVPTALHEFSVQKILPLLATVTTSAEVAAALAALDPAQAP